MGSEVSLRFLACFFTRVFGRGFMPFISCNEVPMEYGLSSSIVVNTYVSGL